MLNDPAIVFTTTPQNMMKYVDFMHKIGSIKVEARLVEGHVLPERAQAAGKLMREHAGGGARARRDLAAIRDAHARIAPHVHRTPVMTCQALDDEVGASLFFKCENLQKVGAFKARGACNAVFSLDDAEARRGVVTHSSGNHGAALAYAAQRRGIPAWVVMPENAPAVKQANVRRFGATVRLCAPTVAAREAACDEVRARNRRDADPSLRRFARHRRAGHRGAGAAGSDRRDLDAIIAPCRRRRLALRHGDRRDVAAARHSRATAPSRPTPTTPRAVSRADTLQPLAARTTIADGLRTSLRAGR